jgi:hypothetical protein
MIVISYIFIVLMLTISIFLYLKLKTDTSRKNVKITKDMTYKVKDKNYKLPGCLEIIGTGYLLQEDFLSKMRELFEATSRFLNSQDIPFVVSGGSLLGFIRHKTFIPWDDDLDAHIIGDRRDYFFSEKFTKDIKKFNLEALYLKGTTANYSFYKAAIRLRLKGKSRPVFDLFFTNIGEETVSKIENWDKHKLYYNKKEIWDKEHILPVKKEIIDDMEVNLPATPHRVLKSQYGIDYMSTFVCSNIPHDIMYENTKFIWSIK